MPSSNRPSRAESLFFGFLASLPEGAEPDVEPLCAQHAQLAGELRALREQYLRGEALVAGLSPARTGPFSDGRSTAGRYTIRREIARGGMGTVLEVWDEELRRPLAMKVLREADPNSEGLLAPIGRERHRSRLLNEAQILGQLDHPGIVPVIEVGRNEGGELFFTMQLVQGRELAEIFRLVRAGEEGWSLTRAVGALQRVCEAMAYAHERGVVHRDLKPENVMVGRFGETYVMDWGLAKARGRADTADIRLREVHIDADAEGAPSMQEASAVRRSVHTDRRDASDDDTFSPLRTYDGDVVGTPAYMSPEQAAGDVEAVDERSDIYCVGAILYQLLSGVMPYAEACRQGPREMLAAVRAGPPSALAHIVRRVPAELVAVCEKAMARDRRERYSSMQAMAGDLRAWMEGRVVGAHRTGPMTQLLKWSRRQRLAAVLLSILFVVVGASAVIFAILYAQSEERRMAAAVAQADSLRRQSAPFAQHPGGVRLPTFTDDFDDGRIDRRWVVGEDARRVEERDGRLQLTTTNSSYTCVTLDSIVNVIEGDFDLEIDFSLTNFTVPAIPRAERHAGVMIYPVGEGRDLLLQIARHAEYESVVTPGVEQSCRATDAEGRVESVEDARTSGRFRIVRRGATISTYRWDADWRELLAGDYTTEDLLIILFCRDYYFEDPATFAVERLSFRTYERRPGRSLTALDDDFSGPYLHPSLRRRADAGLVAVLGGELHMEKLEGRTGHVTVELDRQGDLALRGDFDLSVGFELDRFPIPVNGEASLGLRVSTPDFAPFGELFVVASDGELRYEAHGNGESARAKVRGTSGRLRIQRRGPGIHCLIWNDGWQELFVRREVHGEPEMLFAIELRSSSEEQYVVLLDNLHASSTP